MGSALRLVKNSTGLAKAVTQAFADHRHRAHGRQLTLPERADWLHHSSRQTLQSMGINFSVSGPLPGPGLIVSNHLSYLDILIFSAAVPSVFVSKAEVKTWPVFGKLATAGGTVYVDRSRRTDTRNANDGIREALQHGLRVVVFPEGTSSDGSDVLPFYASLFGPAAETSTPIYGAYLSYKIQDGSVGRDIAYWGDMTFFPHLLKLLSRCGISAHLTFAESSRSFSDRKTAAREMREEVLRLRSMSDSTTSSRATSS